MEFVENRIGDEPVYHCIDPLVFTVDNLLTDEEIELNEEYEYFLESGILFNHLPT